MLVAAQDMYRNRWVTPIVTQLTVNLILVIHGMWADTSSTGYPIHAEWKTCRGPSEEGKRAQQARKQRVLRIELYWSGMLSYQIINGAEIGSINPATLRNPECLVEFYELGIKLRKQVEEVAWLLYTIVAVE